MRAAWTLAVLVLGMALATVAWGQRGDPRAGEEIANECIACHGPAGNEPIEPDYPKIGGQHYTYMVHILKRYRAGDIDDPIMTPIAEGLSDRDIRNLAAFFAAQDGDLYTPRRR